MKIVYNKLYKDVIFMAKKKSPQEIKSQLLVDYFFNIRGKAILVFTILLLVSVALAYLFKGVIDNRIMHFVFGSLSILLLLILLLVILKVFSKRYSAKEVEESIANDRKLAFMGAFDNLAIKNQKCDYVTEPLEVIAPQNYPGKKDILYRYDKKAKKLFYSQTGYNWIFFGKDSLFLYQVIINHIHSYIGYEVASEVQYKDIVEVKTITSKEGKFQTLKMILTLVNGDSISVQLRNNLLKIEGSTLNLSELEKKVVNKVRTTIREQR